MIERGLQGESGGGGVGLPVEAAGGQEGIGEKLVVVESPAMVMTAEGFVEADVRAGIALGKEADILARLRSQGWSEEAIAAFRSGRTVIMELQKTPFGWLKTGEEWKGKSEGGFRDEGDAGEAGS